MPPISALLNLGPKSAAWLAAVGIVTLEDLEEIGVVEAYLRVKQAFPDRVTLNLLWGLQASLLNIHYKELPPGLKDKLKMEVQKNLGQTTKKG